MPAFELHAHTTASDGVLSPTQLVERAHARGLRALAVTDHDTTAGVPEAAARAAALGLELIPGLEASCEGPCAGGGAQEVHILGLFVDPASAALEGAFAALRERRRERLGEMLAKLASLGVHVPADAVPAHGARALGRPHVARALVALGHARDVQDAFERYLAIGRPAYLEKALLPAADGIRAIRAAGGLPVIAHPGRYPAPVDLDALAALGIGGIEVYYPAHKPEAQARFLADARRLGLVATGGADFHGDSKRAPDLGGQEMPEGVLEEVRGAVGRG